jgi:predicted NAD-dependent protein-ADP-ribosyltransferase YbiA (DUF1768 family)
LETIEVASTEVSQRPSDISMTRETVEPVILPVDEEFAREWASTTTFRPLSVVKIEEGLRAGKTAHVIDRYIDFALVHDANTPFKLQRPDGLIKYHSAAQALLESKIRFVMDRAGPGSPEFARCEETIAKVRRAPDPKTAASLAEVVTSMDAFDPDEWKKQAVDQHVRVLREKASQSDAVREALMQSGRHSIVHVDSLPAWKGLGVDDKDWNKDDAAKLAQLKRRDTNWLGSIWMEIRNDLQSDEEAIRPAAPETVTKSPQASRGETDRPSAEE